MEQLCCLCWAAPRKVTAQAGPQPSGGCPRDFSVSVRDEPTPPKPSCLSFVTPNASVDRNSPVGVRVLPALPLCVLPFCVSGDL